MAFQPAPNVAQVTLVHNLTDGAAGVNVFHVLGDSGGWTTEELEDLNDLFGDWWTTNVRAHVSSQIALRSIESRSLEAEIAPVATLPFVPVLAGGSSSPALPANTTIVISHRTGLTGRSARGRTYFIGLNEGQVNGNYVSGPTATNLNNAFAQLGQDLRDAGLALAVLSRFSGGVARPLAVAFEVVSSLLLDNRIDTQRRRLPRTYGN